MTREEIEARMTPAGGYTRATLAEWGVPWPPPKGWKAALLAQGTLLREDPKGLRPKASGPVGAADAPKTSPTPQGHRGERPS